MTKFLDGPAAGQCLYLQRAPKYLRVTRNAKGEFDALDQLHDAPLPDETLTAYRRVGEPSVIHVCGCGSRNGRRVGGWYQAARYEVDEVQPADNVMRDYMTWKVWVVSRMPGATV